MRELLVDSRCVMDEFGKSRTFDYAILIEEHDANPFFCESYGIKIAEQGSQNLCLVPDVTTNLTQIDALMDLLLRNEVLPGNLLDVIIDWL